MNESEHQSDKNWAKQLKVSQLKLILKARSINEERGCVERSELETLAIANFSSLEEAQQVILEVSKQNTSNKKGKSKSPIEREILARLKSVLGQDRGVLDFRHYEVSQHHINRLLDYKKATPEIFDNPTISSRDKWFKHPNFSKNEQMPPYHVHYRVEMQESMRSMYDCFASTSEKNQSRAAKRCSSYFDGCMAGLDGHVSIEEHHWFPALQRKFSNLDIGFLYKDHASLHKEERKVKRELRQLQEKATTCLVPREEILPALKILLDFDTQLMSHLGEEEEVVVPMMISSPRRIV